MKCHLCKVNDANIQIQVHNHLLKMDQTVQLCQDCAEERGITPQNMNREQIEKVIQELQDAQTPAAKCEKCGTTLLDLQRNNQLGCSECYEHLEEFIKKELLQIHKRTQHVLEPQTNPQAQKLYQISILEKELQFNIDNENYEKAAEIRDQLKLLTI